MVKCKIDDPLDAVAVHFGGGAWGVISVALLKYEIGGDANGVLIDWDKQAFLMLAWQCLGLVVICSWTAVLSGLMFGILKAAGALRVSKELEKKGLDIPKHGEPAYPLESYGHGYLEKIITILENGQLGTSDLGFANAGFTGESKNGNFENPEQMVMGHANTHFTINRSPSNSKRVPNNGNGDSARGPDNTRM